MNTEKVKVKVYKTFNSTIDDAKKHLTESIQLLIKLKINPLIMNNITSLLLKTIKTLNSGMVYYESWTPEKLKKRTHTPQVQGSSDTSAQTK